MSYRDSAKRILDGKRLAYQKQNTFVQVQESGFPHLDLSVYRRMRKDLEGEGLRYLCDLEIPEVSNKPGSLLAPTMIRTLVSPNGICADYYQIKSRIGRRLKSLLRGMINRRWIDAPRGFIKAMKTRHCVGFETEFSDGSFITTSNAEGAGALSSPPEIDAQFYPYGTPWQTLLDSHRRRVQAKLAAHPQLQAIDLQTLEDVRAMGRRQKELKNAHRANIGWVTKEELITLSKGNPAVAEGVYAEIQNILLEEKFEKTVKLSPEADEFLKQAVAEYNGKQEQLKDVWLFEAFDRWEYDQQNGLLTLWFPDSTCVLADGQLLGTYCASDGTFEWAWNNPHFGPAITEDSKRARLLGEQLQISYMSAGMIPVVHDMLLYIGAIGIKAAASSGVFRGREGHVHPLISVKNLRWG